MTSRPDSGRAPHRRDDGNAPPGGADERDNLATESDRQREDDPNPLTTDIPKKLATELPRGDDVNEAPA